MRERAVRAAVAVCALLLLAGCGQAPGPSASGIATEAATPAGAGTVGDRPPHYDENHRYRERVPVGADAQRVLESARSDVLRRLDGLSAPPTVAAVTAVVRTTGEDDPWVAEDGSGGVAFESEVAQSGCLIGGVAKDGSATAKTGGFVMDGGCHALSGH